MRTKGLLAAVRLDCLRKLGHRLRRSAVGSFLEERRGNILIITSLLLPPFVLGAGIAIDMSMAYQSKVSMQQSLDAAALAAAKLYGTTQNAQELEKVASAYFYANDNSNNGGDKSDNTAFHYDGVATVNGFLVMQVSATKDVPTFFGGAIKAMTGGQVDYTKVHMVDASKVIIENKSIELALVLDNSGSMRDAPDSGGGSAKITTLRNAMTDLATQLMAKNSSSSSNTASAVKIGVVPFSSSVKVGKSHRYDAWMDTKGLSPTHHENFDWDTWTAAGPLPSITPTKQAVAVPVVGANPARNAYKDLAGNWLTRFYVYENAKRNGTRRFGDWMGCVESRPNGLAFTDADANESNPESLFVPTFAPDEPNNGEFSNTYLDYSAVGASKIAQQRNMNKYMNSTSANHIDEENGISPNYGCYEIPEIQPLTGNKDTVVNTVKALTPDGGTNIPEGMAWGWRTLSAKAPFTEGKPSNTKDNLKVLILVTDGENTYYPSYVSTGKPVETNNINMSRYGTYGYGQIWSKDAVPVESVGHIFDGLTTTTRKSTAANYYSAMNEMLGKVCTNIKNDGKIYKTDGSDGIVVATIAFDLPDGSPVKTLLQNCASKGMDGKSAPLYFDAKKSSDLVDAINNLVGQLSALRIYR